MRLVRGSPVPISNTRVSSALYIVHVIHDNSFHVLRVQYILYRALDSLPWTILYKRLEQLNQIIREGSIGRVHPFFKFLRHNPLLVELDELNWMVPEFSKLNNGKLLLAGVLCLVTWHSRDSSRDLVTTSNRNCARLSAKIARIGCRSFEH